MSMSIFKSSVRLSQAVRQKMKDTSILITPRRLMPAWPTATLPELKGVAKDTVIACLSRYGTGRTKESDTVVNKIQVGDGRWLICACKGKGPNPPTLYFRSKFLVRHPSAERAECASQIVCETASQKLSLLTKFRVAGAPPRETVRKEGQWRRRSTLARLLCSLLSEAEIQMTRAGSRRPELAEQIKKLQQVAERYSVDDKVTLKQAFSTDPTEFDPFKALLASNELPWSPTARRQGVFVYPVERMEGRTLFPFGECDPIPVSERIAVYGEMTPDDDEPEEGHVNSRSPYLCIGVIGQRSENGPFEALSCYLHPCYK